MLKCWLRVAAERLWRWRRSAPKDLGLEERLGTP
jgi:hypothetical protein